MRSSLMSLSVIVVLLGLLGTPVAAESAPVNVAVVDFQQALNSVKEGKRAKDALKKEFEAKQKQLDLMQQELQKMKTDIEKQRVVLSDTALRSKEEAFKKKFLDIQQKMAEFRQNLATREAELTGKILQKLKDIVADIGAKKDYDLVVEKSQDVVLYAKSKDDITEEVITIYNKKNK
jgi:outer membrane protein